MGADDRATGIRWPAASSSTRVVSSAKCSGLIIQLVTNEMKGLRTRASRPPAIIAAMSITSRAL